MLGKTWLVVTTLALAVAACPPTRYAFAPVTTTSAEIVGHPAADHPFPPESPHGRVRLATFGIAQLSRGSPWYFHVRMSATNQGNATWVIDRTDQVLEVAIGDDAERKTRVRAATDVDESAARVEVAPGATASIDLFFPLPPGARDATEIPSLEVIWTVHEDGRGIVMATPFERFLASGPALGVPRPDPTSYPGGAGPPRRPPGTPDTRWPQPEPEPHPPLVPQAPLP